MRTYDFILGMGPSCHCSQALRAAGLQLLSLPFDWVGGPALPTKAQHMVESFPGWFGPGTLKPIAAASKTQLTTALSDCFGYTPVHDFHHGVPVEDERPRVLAKYRRRIERMERLIESSSRVLVAYLEMPGFPPAAVADPQEVRGILAARWPRVAFDFLVIRNAEGPAADADEEEGGVRIVTRKYLTSGGPVPVAAVDGLAAWLKGEYAVKDYRTETERRDHRRKVRQRKYAELHASNLWDYCWTRLQYKLYRHLHKRLACKGIV